MGKHQKRHDQTAEQRSETEGAHMPFNYSYQLNPNPKLTSLSNIKFDPVTEEYSEHIERFKKMHHQAAIKTVIIGILFLIVSLGILGLGLYIFVNFPEIRGVIVLNISLALAFSVPSVLCFLSYPIKVTGIKEAVVADRETHEYYIDNAYGMPEQTSSDRVTLKFADTDKEVSIVTDSHVQMHCIPGKAVLLLMTSKGPKILAD